MEGVGKGNHLLLTDYQGVTRRRWPNFEDDISVRIQLGNMVFVLWVLFGASFSIAQQAVSPSAAVTNNIDALMAEGRRLLQTGDTNKALQVFESVLKQDASNAEALFRAGIIYLRLNQISKGIEYVERSLSASPGNIRVRLVLAQAYENAQQLDKALAEYRRVQDMAKNSPEAIEARKRERIISGKQYGKEGKFDQALQEFSSVLADYPNDVPTLLDDGLTLMFMGRFTEAQSVLEKALSLQPDNPLIHRYLGEVAEKNGDLKASAQHYERTLQLLPPNTPAADLIKTKLAFIHAAEFLAEGKLEDARKEYEKVIAADPHNVAARSALSKIYHDLGDLPRAVEMLKSLHQDNPGDLSVGLRLGATYLEQNKLEEAAKELEYVVANGKLGPEAQQAEKLLATIRTNAEQNFAGSMSNDDRIALYRSMLDKNPGDRTTWLSLGMLYARLQRRDDAIAAFENALRLSPNDVQTQAMLGGMYDEAGRFDKAVEVLGRAMDMEKDPAQKQKLGRDIALVLAKKAYTAGKFDEAQREFTAIIAENNDDYVAHFFLALIYTKDEKFDKAAAEYNEVLRIVPRHVLAKLSLAAINEQTGHEEEAANEYQSVAISRVPGYSDMARDRLTQLMKRVGGFSFNVGYSLNYDSNSNLSPTTPDAELRSDTTGTMAYQRKVRGKRLFWGMRLTPTYSVYHQEQFDFLTTDVTPYLSGVWHDVNLSANYDYSQTDGVLVAQHYNKSNSLNADASKRFKMIALLPFLTPEEQRKSIPSVWRINGTYRTYRSPAFPIFNANTYSVGAMLTQSSLSGWSWIGAYTYTGNDSLSAISNDFAYTSHGINLQLSKNITPQLSINGGYGFMYSGYTHPDSVTRFTAFRIDKFQSFSLGLNYTVNDSLKLICGYGYQQNDSNLPTGFILSTQNVGTAVGIQSPSLGEYRKYIIMTGLMMSF